VIVVLWSNTTGGCGDDVVATVVVFSALLISALKTCQYGEREVV
jgi:hypothetical protein